jgi:hypothetical protein
MVLFFVIRVPIALSTTFRAPMKRPTSRVRLCVRFIRSRRNDFPTHFLILSVSGRAGASSGSCRSVRPGSRRTIRSRSTSSRRRSSRGGRWFGSAIFCVVSLFTALITSGVFCIVQFLINSRLDKLVELDLSQVETGRSSGRIFDVLGGGPFPIVQK